MPLPLIGILLAAAAALAVVVVAFVYWDDIVNWFRSRHELIEADKDNIAFTIKQKMANGDFKVVQGVLNKRTNVLADGQVIQTKNVDAGLEQAHEGKELVIYE
jgi:hypothetical protein